LNVFPNTEVKQYQIWCWKY